MNKRVALVSLAVTCGLVASLHLSWVEHDNGHLLQVDGNPIDLMGEIGVFAAPRRLPAGAGLFDLGPEALADTMRRDHARFGTLVAELGLRSE